MQNGMNKKYIFDQHSWYSGDENGYISDQDRSSMIVLQKQYPELCDWSILSILWAWGDYSRDMFEVMHVEWLDDERMESFLGYLYIMENLFSLSTGCFDWTDHVHFDFDLLDDYSSTQPWLNSAPLPPWTNDLINRINEFNNDQ